eukprot:3768664-Rhodomonas_salina.1
MPGTSRLGCEFACTLRRSVLTSRVMGPGPLVEEEERESQEGGGGQNAAGVSMTAARARRSSLPEVREGMQIGRSGSRL